MTRFYRFAQFGGVAMLVVVALAMQSRGGNIRAAALSNARHLLPAEMHAAVGGACDHSCCDYHNNSTFSCADCLITGATCPHDGETQIIYQGPFYSDPSDPNITPSEKPCWVERVCAVKPDEPHKQCVDAGGIGGPYWSCGDPSGNAHCTVCYGGTWTIVYQTKKFC